jgi:hypothetical protein
VDAGQLLLWTAPCLERRRRGRGGAAGRLARTTTLLSDALASQRLGVEDAEW